MGWSGGSELMEKVLDATLPEIQADKRRAVCEMLIEAFEDEDADTLDECRGKHPEFDAALDALYKKRGWT